MKYYNPHCSNCIYFNQPNECINCQDAPQYKDYPKRSKFIEYKITCPKGYAYCVHDPAYIKFYHPEWYAELYGDKTPKEIMEVCSSCNRGEEFCDDYDDEDR